jgi:hypothetical protein
MISRRNLVRTPQKKSAGSAILHILTGALMLCTWLGACGSSLAQTPTPTLLALEKGSQTLAIIDPAALKVIARVPSGPDPHEVIASTDGTRAYISNYGGEGSSFNSISVVDLAAQKALTPISLGALRSPHGLDFAGGKLYFTAETSKAIGRYDPATDLVDWILGTGQDRTHMILVSSDLKRIITSNVRSGTISIIEESAQPMGGFPPPSAAPHSPGASALPRPPQPPSGAREFWEVTNVPSGRGSEGFDVSADGKEIWAANAQDDSITIIDVGSKRAVQTIAIGLHGANRLKFTHDGRHVLVSGLGAAPNSNGTDLLVLDAGSRKVIKQFALGGGAAGILIAPDDSRAFVSVTGGDKIAVLDLKTLRLAGEIAPVSHPDGLAWASRQ